MELTREFPPSSTRFFKIPHWLDRRATIRLKGWAGLKPKGKLRDWQIDFGPVFGKEGEVKTITIQPRVLFRGEKIIATDTAKFPGTGTVINAIFVGRKMQLPWPLPTNHFGMSVTGNGIHMDTCDRALSISAQIEFLEPCTFDMCIFGKAAIDD